MLAMETAHDVVTPERFAQGMTFAQYLDDIGMPENLAREAGWWRGPERVVDPRTAIRPPTGLEQRPNRPE